MIHHCTVGGRTFAVDTRRPLDWKPLGGGVYSLMLDGRSWIFTAERREGGWTISLGGRRLDVAVADDLEHRLDQGRKGPARRGPETVRAPMPGVVTRVAAAPGQAVKAGDLLLVLEAMKMANEVCARHEGIVKTVPVSPGQAVSAGETLVILS